jgi:hypothetical protein
MALGVLLLPTGAVFLAMLLVDTLRGDGGFWSVLSWVLLVIGVVLLVGVVRALWRIARPPVALTLDDQGYRLAALAGAGAMAASWRDVRRVESVDRSGEVGVVVHLHDGRTTRIVARMVSEPMATWVADLDDRLNRAHGQRRL